MNTREQSYKIRTLNLYNIIDFLSSIEISGIANTEPYKLDLSNLAVYDSVISNVQIYPDTAFFYQSRCAACVDNKKDALLDLILFLDCKGVFSTNNECAVKKGKKNEAKKERKNSIQKYAESIFVNGIKIRFNKNEEYNLFLPFDKSGSMSREARITFVSTKSIYGEPFRKRLDERICLGINFADMKGIIASKFYAYRGLMLTAAKRIELCSLLGSDISDNELKDIAKKLASLIIVINTGKDSIVPPNEEINVISAREDNANKWTRTIERKTYKDHSIDRFDGEGLISNDLSSLVNSLLGEEEHRITSYQIRLPFGKGMLHEVDFHRFFREELKLPEDSLIEDIYHNKRRIYDAQIILTSSMFKCAGWLTRCYKEELDGFNDLMEFYFYRCLKYKHALYIGNTNMMLHNDGYVRLNYQFLSTIDLNKEQIEELFNQHAALVPQVAKGKMLFSIDNTDNSFSDDDSSNSQISPWIQAYNYCENKQKETLLEDSKVAGMLRGTIESLHRDAAIGRILARGEYRFLSRDLLALLLDFANMIDNKSVRVESIKRSNTIRTNHYYMPRMLHAKHVKREAYAAILRNPHLSRNEEALAKRGYEVADKPYYQEYFSHLKGVVMVSYDSLIPMAVGGADFDGDLVMVVHEPIIVDAIKRGVYSNNCETEQDDLKRSLYIIDIPEVRGTPQENGLCGVDDLHYGIPIDYESIRQTFNSRVGLISNMAVRFAKQDAISVLKNNDNHGNTDSAECTILTGLEIDAAKNGRRPSFESINNRLALLDKNDKNKVDGNDYFIGFKEKFLTLPKFSRSWHKTANGDYQIVHRFRKCFTVKKPTTENGLSPIDALPWYYFQKIDNQNAQLESATQEYCVKSHGSQETAKKPELYYFHNYSESYDSVKDNILEIIRAYTSVIKRASIDYKNEMLSQNARYCEAIKSILRLQYDSLFANCFLSEKTVLDVFQDAYGYIRDRIYNTHNDCRTESDTEEAKSDIDHKIAMMDGECWAFMDREAKDAFIKKYIGALNMTNQEDSNVMTLLTNFSQGGYKILYYMLKSIYCDIITSDYDPDPTTDISNTNDGSSLQLKYFQIYRMGKREKLLRKDWHSRLVEECKKDISNLFADKKDFWDYVMKIAWEERKKNGADYRGDFFWNVIPPVVIANNTVPSKKTNKKKGGEFNA